jgi:PTH1 family peptidyl-tRNA hydrolase
MGLFQERPSTGDNAPLYTTGMNKTVLIVGLGNIGKEYNNTRHNIGFEIIDFFAAKHGFDPWVSKKDQFCVTTSKTIGSTRVILCKPTTYMNESGRALQAVQRFYKIANSSTLVVYDELDIHFGQLRTRIGGGSAGHNGVKSLIAHCGDDFGRLRIGIGPNSSAHIDSADFVLAAFGKKDTAMIPLLLIEANSILSEYAHNAGQLQEETRSFTL